MNHGNSGGNRTQNLFCVEEKSAVLKFSGGGGATRKVKETRWRLEYSVNHRGYLLMLRYRAESSGVSPHYPSAPSGIDH